MVTGLEVSGRGLSCALSPVHLQGLGDSVFRVSQAEQQAISDANLTLTLTPTLLDPKPDPLTLPDPHP